ncbi:hypothetical protein OCU04_010172 [Sclerotinia nivalis]|uniref:Uncharacterized protein n=1 Tax=Sclerotinia nivalis TaxID=352851 RepID=A0A9X0DHL8_9HELO|nr:hypothetical protein OCU04_010172 [Sclerotinia nivalis]
MASNVIDSMQSEQCLKHGHFMQSLSPSKVKSIFWVLFLVVLVMLTIAASAFTKSANIATHIKNAELHPTISRDLCQDLLSKSKAKHRRTQIRCIYVSSLCFIVAIFCTVFEAFAASTLIFCHKLDMGFLYWSFWTLLQVGSTIAIFGIALAQLWSCMGRESLPVNVAIGTPVLIIAWLGVAFEYLFKAWLSEETIKRFETFVDGVIDSSRQSRTSSEAETSTPSIPTAELLGFTIDSRPIISFNKLSDAVHPMARHFATTENGRSIYIYGAIPTDSANASADNDKDSAAGLNVSTANGTLESGRVSRTINFQDERGAVSTRASTPGSSVNRSQVSESDDSTLGRSLTSGSLTDGRFGSDESV